MQTKLTLFTLPFAGGNFYSYRALQPYLPPTVKMQPLEPPGRGRRIAEPLLSDLELMADDVLQKFRSYDLDQPYLIYGHSMGGLLGYLLIQRLQLQHMPLPVHFIVSGRRSPDKPYNRIMHTLPVSEFIQWLKTLGGLPQSILDSEEMMQMITPILQSDFQAAETFDYNQRPRIPLHVPISAFYGTNESISDEDMANWHHESEQPVLTEQYEGDHFFIFQSAFLNRFKQLLTEIAQQHQPTYV